MRRIFRRGDRTWVYAVLAVVLSVTKDTSDSNDPTLLIVVAIVGFVVLAYRFGLRLIVPDAALETDRTYVVPPTSIGGNRSAVHANTDGAKIPRPKSPTVARR